MNCCLNEEEGVSDVSATVLMHVNNKTKCFVLATKSLVALPPTPPKFFEAWLRCSMILELGFSQR